MKARIATAAAVALGAQLALVPSPTGAHGPTATVSFHWAQYAPATARVTPGGTVTWAPDPGSSFDAQDLTNGHPLHFDDPSIGDQTSGTDPITRTFANPGVYPFVCLHHGPAGMRGSIVVTFNHPPIASFVPPATPPQQGVPVTLDASSSMDEDPGQTLTYAWDFDDDGTIDQTSTAPTVSHVFPAAGPVTVRLKVTDSNSDAVGPESAEMTLPLDVAPAPSGGGLHPMKPTLTIRPAAGRLVLRQLARHGLTVRATTSGPGLAEATLKRGRRTLARRSIGFVTAGTRPLTLRIGAAGRAALAHARRATLTLTVVFTDEHGGEMRVVRALTVRR
jgi:plastocyanin